VDWARTPKASRTNPYKPSRHAVVEGSWTLEICALISRHPESAPLSTWTTGQISRLLQETSGRPLTAHSIKRGAISVLLAAVAAGELDGEIVSRLAKHNAPAPIADSTVRYAGNMVHLALAQGTAAATRLL
jgi:hypothetical protein